MDAVKPHRFPALSYHHLVNLGGCVLSCSKASIVWISFTVGDLSLLPENSAKLKIPFLFYDLLFLSQLPFLLYHRSKTRVHIIYSEAIVNIIFVVF